MSPRPKRYRKVLNPPAMAGFKPYGPRKGNIGAGIVFLLYEEYESMRLCDHMGMNHQQAAEAMNVSRPTLTRIYATARRKIAEALVMGRHLVIEGGKVYYDSEWYACTDCGCYFNHPEKNKSVQSCPLCNSNRFKLYSEDSIDIPPGIEDNPEIS